MIAIQCKYEGASESDPYLWMNELRGGPGDGYLLSVNACPVHGHQMFGYMNNDGWQVAYWYQFDETLGAWLFQRTGPRSETE
jgi:hypothetical protein